jgi:hypothetical protein
MSMPQVFDGLVREHAAPALKRHGLRKKRRATWWERRPSGAWVLLALRNDKWNSAAEVRFWAEAVGWPPGTWELESEILGADPAGQPYVAASSPLVLDLPLPVAGAPPGDAWLLSADVDPAVLAGDVTDWCDQALPTFWTASMLPHLRERFATPQEAYRAGIGREFHYADGTSSPAPPPGWLEPPPPHRRRRPVPRWSRRGGAEETGQSRHGTGPEP